MGDDISTAQLASRTGVRAATLRMWESRHGFPRPLDTGGRRRYPPREAVLVTEVVRLRADGLSLTAAIARVRDSAVAPAPPSIFAALRERRPELPPVVLRKRALLAMTRALEDEYCARGSAGVLYASFQRAEFYRRSERRWREVARTADLAVVLADFDTFRRRGRGPVEVPVAREHPLAREWTLVIDAPGVKACVAAWEKPAEQLPDRLRSFEVVWSCEHEVVAAASAVAARIVATAAPSLADELPDASARSLGGAAELRFAAALGHRIVGYLTAQHVPV